VENAPEAIFVSGQGYFRYLNPAALRLFGATSDSELLNQPVLEHVHPDSRAYVTQAIQQVEKLGAPIPPWCRSISGSTDGPRHRGVRRTFIYKGEKGGLVFVRDVSERTRAEEELRAKEYLLSESQSIAHVGSWEATLQSGATTWTPEAFRLFGVSPDTFVPSAETFVSLIHPDDQPAMQAWMGACLAGLEPPDLEFRVPLQDGSVRYINGRGHLVRTRSTNRSAWWASFRTSPTSDGPRSCCSCEPRNSSVPTPSWSSSPTWPPHDLQEAIADGFQLHAASGAPLPG